jgi:hypothetical protein
MEESDREKKRKNSYDKDNKIKSAFDEIQKESGNHQYKLVCVLMIAPTTNDELGIRKSDLINFIPANLNGRLHIELLKKKHKYKYNIYKLVLYYENYQYLRGVAFRITELFHPDYFLGGKLGHIDKISEEINWKKKC